MTNKYQKPIQPYEIVWHIEEVKKWVKKVGIDIAIREFKKHSNFIKEIIKPITSPNP